jgi:hypothetical protein
MPLRFYFRSQRALCALFALLLVTTAWFYSWAPANYPVRLTSTLGDGLYGELTQAYLRGQIYLERVPSEGLKTLADPYDPTQNKIYRVNDLSYFKGRYFLYHGFAPVLTAYLPFRILTGVHLTAQSVILFFCVGGAAFSILLLLEIKRRATPKASTACLIACASAALYCHGYYLVLRNTDINQVAIASAYCFLMVSLFSGFKAIVGARKIWPWLLLASTTYSLAIASRPNLVFGSLALLIPLVFAQGQNLSQAGTFRRFGINVAALALPLIFTICAILDYNFIRFGQILEFGQRYMLGGWDQRALGFWGIKYIPLNTWYYFMAPGQLSPEFPFVTTNSWLALGVFFQTPFVVIAASIWTLKSRSSAVRSKTLLQPFSGMLAIILICNLAVLLALPSGNDQAVLASANARYTFDFLPTLVLLSCVGALAMDQQLYGQRLRHWWRACTVSLVFVSMLTAVSLDLSRFPAESYRSLAQKLNWPGHLILSGMGATYGPVKFDVSFPPNKTNVYEPLLATGTPASGDLIYVWYESPTNLRFGLVGTAMKGPESASISIIYGRPYQLEISMGSLFPSGGNPLLSAWNDQQVAQAKRTIQIRLNGITVFEAAAHFSPSKSSEVSVGETPMLRDYCQPQFSGQIINISRLPLVPLKAAISTDPTYGFVRLLLKFPANKTGLGEPLIVSGIRGAGDVLYAHYENKTHLVLGLDHWGSRGVQTPLLKVDYSAKHILEFESGALVPPRGHVLLSNHAAAEIEHLKNRVRVILDGQIVIDTERPAYDSSPYDVFIGRNTIGASTSGYEFTGTIEKIDRLPLFGPKQR